MNNTTPRKTIAPKKMNANLALIKNAIIIAKINMNGALAHILITI